MAEGGYKKQLWNSRNMRPGDTDAAQFKTSMRKPGLPGGSRISGGMSSATAPYKHETEKFDSKHGFNISFGRTGLTGET